MTLPPGPKVPSFVAGYRFGRDPYAYLEACAAEFGDTFTLPLPGGPRFVTRDPALVKQIFALKPDDLEQRLNAFPANIGDRSLLFLDGERHQRERQLMMPHLHGERLKGYAEVMQRLTRETLATWRPGELVRIQAELQRITLGAILECVFGVASDERSRPLREALLAWIDGVMQPATFFASTIFNATRVRRFLDGAADRQERGAMGRLESRMPWAPWAKGKAHVVRHLRAEVERCRSEGRGDRADILALLAHATYEDGSRMEIDAIVDQLVTILVGGHETTATTLAWTLLHLLSEPRLVVDVRAEIDRVFGGGPIDPSRAGELALVDASIKEAMRLTPIAPAVTRHLRRPLSLGPYDLPAGAIVWPCVMLTHRRPDLFPDPTRYDPTRFLTSTAPNHHFFPFGGGRRACIGLSFAAFEMRIVLAEILHAAELALRPGDRVPAELRGITIAPAKGFSLSYRGPRSARVPSGLDVARA
ncbi:MAG: cytochrome P450 [Polyangiaceae bacterium]